MNKAYQIINRTTGEIVAECKTEKDVTAIIRDIILPDFPQGLSEYDVLVITDHDGIQYRMYDFAVSTKVIKGAHKK